MQIAKTKRVFRVSVAVFPAIISGVLMNVELISVAVVPGITPHFYAPVVKAAATIDAPPTKGRITTRGAAIINVLRRVILETNDAREIGRTKCARPIRSMPDVRGGVPPMCAPLG